MIASNGPSAATGSSRSPSRKSIRSATPMRRGVCPGDRKGRFGDVNGHEPALGLAVRRGDRQTARAGSHIDGSRRSNVTRRREIFDDHEFRFGTRNQNGRSDLERQRIKLLAANQVGDGRSFGASANQVAKRARAMSG